MVQNMKNEHCSTTRPSASDHDTAIGPALHTPSSFKADAPWVGHPRPLNRSSAGVWRAGWPYEVQCATSLPCANRAQRDQSQGSAPETRPARRINTSLGGVRSFIGHLRQLRRWCPWRALAARWVGGARSALSRMHSRHTLEGTLDTL